MTKAAIYARVSSERQEREKTIESQLAELREICNRNKVAVIKEYIDNGWSGSLLERPALDELRDDAKKGLWGTLYIYSVDRLSRDHLNQLLVIRELKQEGIEIVFRDQPLNDQNKLLFDIESIVGEYERKLILERTRRGKLHKAKEGKIINSYPPYGYKFEIDKNKEKKIVIDGEETKVVKLIFELYLKYKSTCLVTKELWKRGILSRTNKRWRTACVYNVLKNESYIGNWHYGKTEAVKPENPRSKFHRLEKSSYRKKKEWIIIKIPTIISEAKFEAVQGLMKKNHKLYGTTKHFWLLRGLIRCSKCGSRMTGDAKRKYRYYRCSKGVEFAERTCDAKSVRAEQIENTVWSKIKEALQRPDVLIKYSSVLNEKNKQKRSIEDEKKSLLRQKESIGAKKDKLFELYEIDSIDKDILTERLGIYGEQEKKINKLLEDIEIRLKQLEQKGILIKRLNTLSKLVKAQLDILTQEEKRTLLQSIIEEIIYNPVDGIFIKGCIDLGDVETKKEVFTSLATSSLMS